MHTSRDPSLYQLYTDDDSKDISFTHGDYSIKAHSDVLERQSPHLFELTVGSSRVQLDPNINIEAFNYIIQHIYTVLDYDKIRFSLHGAVCLLKEADVSLLKEADRLECTDLKLFVESTIADKFLKGDNAAELLVLAESHSCTLLKEASIQMYLKSTTTVVKSQEWSMVKVDPELMSEIREAPALVAEYPNDTTNSSRLSFSNETVQNWDVSTLRRFLEAENLDLDGSKAVLVQRLVAHYNPESST